ncbi:MAG: hypothetical protein ACRDBL_09550 [Rhabdaerophilum sp.]
MSITIEPMDQEANSEVALFIAASGGAAPAIWALLCLFGQIYQAAETFVPGDPNQASDLQLAVLDALSDPRSALERGQHLCSPQKMVPFPLCHVERTP